MSLRPCGCGGGPSLAGLESGGARNITTEPLVPFCDVCGERIDRRGGGRCVIENGARRDMCISCYDKAGENIEDRMNALFDLLDKEVAK